MTSSVFKSDLSIAGFPIKETIIKYIQYYHNNYDEQIYNLINVNDG